MSSGVQAKSMRVALIYWGLHWVLGLIVVAGLLTLSGCSSSSSPASATPLVSDVKTIQKATPVDAIDVRATVDKRQLFNREFLYGADVQYSSYHDPGYDLNTQSTAIGHIPARFRISGSDLQLIADNHRLFPSDVNHPELLLSRFPILSETSTSLTIGGADSSIFLAQVFEGQRNPVSGGLVNPSGAAPRESWIRSFEFAPTGSYILQQSSIVTADGFVAEFMESVFPRENLAAGASFQIIEMDPSSPKGIEDGLLARYRLLPGESIFHGEQQLAYAQHYDITEQTIDWFVTPNIPEDMIAPVREAVEGWNRYFRKFKGIERDVVLFKGRLPAGIHLGDPRYNVINWDSRRVAGAAYETQATDPETGKQSHSLIYMPAAWVAIGETYWKDGGASDTGSVRVPRNARCARDLSEVRDAQLVAAIRNETTETRSPDAVRDFSIALLKQTLFHEVGHALGLGHNFKASLSWDPADAKSMFSTSIMDYNDYEIERGAFTAVDSADGPALEYDRQALSAIYNKGADIDAAQAALPACNDAEADAESDDGVDPLCIRYDAVHDPSQSVTFALNRVLQPMVVGDVSLARALSKIPMLTLGTAAVAAARTEDDVRALAARTAAQFRGVMKFYFVSGKLSVSRTVRNNARMLLKFETDSLPSGYDERGMRLRALGGIKTTLAMMALPEAASVGLKAAQADALTRLGAAPYTQALSGDAREKFLASVAKAIAAPTMKFATDAAAGLLKLRTDLATALARHAKVPFFFGLLAPGPEDPTGNRGTRVDMESELLTLLSDIAGDFVRREPAERVAAATSLKSFVSPGRLDADKIVAAVVTKVTDEYQQATANTARETATAVLAALTAPTSASK